MSKLYTVTVTYRDPQRAERVFYRVANAFTTDGVLAIHDDDSETGIPLDLIAEYRVQDTP